MTYLTMKGFNKTTPPVDYLCFTANTAGSTVQLTKNGSPTSVTIETSTDKVSWITYTMGNTITLSNIGDKVYFRNISETTTGFSKSESSYYQFVMSGSIASSGDVTSLINKNCTDTLYGDYCFFYLFCECTSLTTAPELPATTLTNSCYYSMFSGCSSLTTAPSLPATSLQNLCYYFMFLNCSSLETLPKLSATTLKTDCYRYMFAGCSKIKLSSSQTGAYQTPYRIPVTGTGTIGSNSLNSMFRNTGGSFTGTPTINTTYYTSNTLV